MGKYGSRKKHNREDEQGNRTGPSGLVFGRFFVFAVSRQTLDKPRSPTVFGRRSRSTPASCVTAGGVEFPHTEAPIVKEPNLAIRDVGDAKNVFEPLESSIRKVVGSFLFFPVFRLEFRQRADVDPLSLARHPLEPSDWPSRSAAFRASVSRRRRARIDHSNGRGRRAHS